MKLRQLYLLFLFYPLFYTEGVYAFSPPVYVNVELNKERIYSGKVKATFDLPAGEYCIYWPLNTEEIIEDHLPIKGLDLLYQRTARTFILPGRMTPTKVGPNISFSGLNQSELYSRISKNDDEQFVIEYDFQLPHAAFVQSQEIVFHDYIPLIGTHCNIEAVATAKQTITAHIKSPPKWDLLSPFHISQNEHNVHHLRGEHASFVLGNDYRKEKLITQYGEIELHYRSSEYRRFLPMMTKVFDYYSKTLGPLATKKLIVYESNDQVRSDILGLAAYLKPRQEFLKSLQEYWLNWSEWSLVASICYQWFGATLSTPNKNDLWLIHSLRDYYVYVALSEDNHSYNIFNSYNHSLFGFRFTYMDFQDTTAASLNRLAPKAQLTHGNLESIVRHRHQNPLLFIRNVMALRNLEALVGFANLNKAITSFFEGASQRKKLSPRIFAEQFLDELRQTNVNMSHLTEKVLYEWWTKYGWPDRSINSHKVTKMSHNEFLVEVEVEERGSLEVPSDIYIWDQNGRSYFIPAAAQGLPENKYKAIISAPLDHIEIDPHRLVFDQDRFNNSTEWPSLYFFPGNAKEFHQDAYTLLWFPIASKKPGQDLRFGIQSTIMKYLRGSAQLDLEIAQDFSNPTFNFKYEQDTDWTGIRYSLMANKDFFNQRLASIAISQQNFNSSAEYPLSLSLFARAKQEGSDTKSLHGTLGLVLTMQPSFRPEPCALNYLGQFEQTPAPQGIDKFHYARISNSLSLLCNFSGKLQWRTRLFRGVTTVWENAPRNSYFWPQNLEEAAIRIDRVPDNPHLYINSASMEFLFPFLFPFDVASYVLTKKIRWRTYYDYGEASHHTIYRSSGIGLLLPLGGDVSGAGSLAITQLSFIAVLYQSANDTVYPRSILFDLTGEL